MIDLLNPAAALAASFGGAWAAFKLQAVEKERDLRRSNIAAFNRALMTLMQQANTLRLYQTDMIEPDRQRPGRQFSIRASLPFDLDTLRFDFKSLEFLDTPTEQQLVFELSVEERRYVETLRAINVRSNIVIGDVNPKLASAGFADGGRYGEKDFEKALGQPLYATLERLTDDVIFHVDRTSESLISMKEKVLAAAKKRYSGVKFVNFELPQPTITDKGGA